MPRVSIQDLFVPDDRLTQVLDLLSDASAASDGAGLYELDGQFEVANQPQGSPVEDLIDLHSATNELYVKLGGEGAPEFTAQSNIRVDKAVAEAEEMAEKSGPRPSTKREELAALAFFVFDRLTAILK